MNAFVKELEDYLIAEQAKFYRLAYSYLYNEDEALDAVQNAICQAAKLGISSVAYLRYEKSQREPSLSMLAEIAKIFNVSTDYLLGVIDF